MSDEAVPDPRTRSWRERSAIERALWQAGGDPQYRTERLATSRWLLGLLMAEEDGNTDPPRWWDPRQHP